MTQLVITNGEGTRDACDGISRKFKKMLMNLFELREGKEVIFGQKIVIFL